LTAPQTSGTRNLVHHGARRKHVPRLLLIYSQPEEALTHPDDDEEPSLPRGGTERINRDSFLLNNIKERRTETRVA